MGAGIIWLREKWSWQFPYVLIGEGHFLRILFQKKKQKQKMHTHAHSKDYSLFIWNEFQQASWIFIY